MPDNRMGLTNWDEERWRKHWADQRKEAKCDICGEDTFIEFQEKEYGDKRYTLICSTHCLEQYQSLTNPDTSRSEWIEKGTGI
jgi:hypothetical protein